MASGSSSYIQDDVEPVWLDCDPGHDDMVAIILAAYAPGIKLIGISTTHGNVAVEKTTINALRILKFAGIENVEVVMGQAKPLVRPPRVCPEIHGESGLEGARRELPSATLAEATTYTKAVIRMGQVIGRSPVPVTIVATGCQTNVALFLELYPELKKKIRRIVFMGGAMGLGNTGPVAEFNIQVDPESAKMVMDSGCQVVMIPLEVTHTVLVTDDVRTRLIRMQTPFAETMGELLMFFADTYKRVFGFQDPPLHDPCAVAFVIQPRLFQTTLMRVEVECASPLSFGQTVIVQYCHIHELAHKCDVAGVWRLIFDALTKANSRSPLNPHLSVAERKTAENNDGPVRNSIERTTRSAMEMRSKIEPVKSPTVTVVSPSPVPSSSRPIAPSPSRLSQYSIESMEQSESGDSESISQTDDSQSVSSEPARRIVMLAPQRVQR